MEKYGDLLKLSVCYLMFTILYPLNMNKIFHKKLICTQRMENAKKKKRQLILSLKCNFLSTILKIHIFS